MTIPKPEKSFLETQEWIIPLGLFILFLAFTLPGIAWGAPSIWHPDEIVVRSIKALYGEWRFSEINFDYPDLPQYAMFYLGEIILALGYSDTEVLIASRVLSAVLAGLTIVLTYIIARRSGGSVMIAGLAGLLLLCVSEMTHNGRFAHNDTYVTFFTMLALFFLLSFGRTHRRGWLYGSFISIGMAASSKYIGGILILAPLIVFLVVRRKNIIIEWLNTAETLFIGMTLTYLGYAVGTPKALLWMAYYFKRVFTALQWQVAYGKQPDSIRGIIGQYQVLQGGMGFGLYWLFILALVGTVYQVIIAFRNKTLKPESTIGQLSILLLAVFVLDLPMMISYNYQLRYFLSLMPPLAILAAFFVNDVYTRARQVPTPVPTYLILATVALIVIYSLARLASITLLFVNDSRIPASKFMMALPAGSSLEHTNYPPSYPDGHFAREHNYPLYFPQGESDALPTNKPYKFNMGEAGLDERQTDYLVVDNFTSSKFDDPYLCNLVPVECGFFKQLAAGKSNHYRLIAEFKYSLPSYLPQVEVLFANPDIRIYERIK